MSTWIKTQTNTLVNLAHASTIRIEKSGSGYRLVAFAPGLVLSPEGDERYDITYLREGTKEECEMAMSAIGLILKPITVV